MADFDINIPVLQETTEEPELESHRAPNKGKSILIASSSKGEGKEQIISNTEDSGSSQDSVESCSSKWLISTGKRERSYKLETSIEAKKLKKQSYEGRSSGSRESSFMNWVSTITNGFSQFSEAKPLSFIPPSPPYSYIEEKPNRLSLSRRKDIGTDKDTGFKFLFQSLYLPGYNMKNSTNLHQMGDSEAAKKLKEECKKLEFHIEEDNGVSRCHSHGDQSLNILNGNELHNKVSLPEVKKICSTTGDASPCFSELSSNNKNKVFQNLWITRFSPRVSSSMQNSAMLKGTDITTENSCKNNDC